MHYFPQVQEINMLKQHHLSLIGKLMKVTQRYYGFEALMRVRCSKGLDVVQVLPSTVPTSDPAHCLR